PTYNRSKSLLQTLRTLIRQSLSFSEFEVIVVDDGSTDDTQQCFLCFADDHPFINLRYERHIINKKKAAACNTGIRLAKGELIAFLDDDICPVTGWLESHLNRHQIENKDVSVTGLVLYPPEWEKESNWIRFANDNYRKNKFIRRIGSDGLPPNRFAGGNTSVRRDTLIRVGLFDENSIRLEDVTMGCQLYDAGVPLLFEENALVYHYSEVILSIDATLRSFRRSYEIDQEEINKKYPWFNQRYGHWFLFSPNRDYDTIVRYLTKHLIRLIAHRPFQQVIVKILKMIDRNPELYLKPLFQYVLVCEAVDGIRASKGIY
ncbi:glycosyltransferase family 2 protein, partial [bacterium]|nr:glycosyltransferase family 2 protein [bacterium]